MFVKLLFTKRNSRFGVFAKEIFRRNLCDSVAIQNDKTSYKYLLFLDFEATCDTERRIAQEIIEFPCVKVNLETLKEEARFHQYVKPVSEPILTTFCIQLTGILQEVVDEARTFPDVYRLFEEWRQQENLTKENSLYVTSGDWDLGYMMPRQCEKCNLEVPSHMKEWVDIKKLFGNFRKRFFNSFSDVMRHYDLQFEGRAHSGIDDSLNLLKAARKMIKEGIEFQPTSRLVDSKVEYIINPYLQGKSGNRTRLWIKQEKVL